MANCIETCGNYEILPDPDPEDWFCDDDVKVLCKVADRYVTAPTTKVVGFAPWAFPLAES
jgi:hypothetical protein